VLPLQRLLDERAHALELTAIAKHVTPRAASPATSRSALR
jgi:hypothetical protein